MKAVKDLCADHAVKPAGAVDPWKIEKEPSEGSVNDEFDAIMSGQGRAASESDMADGDYGGSQDAFLKFQDSALAAQAELLDSLSQGSSMFKLAVTSPNTLMMIGQLAEMDGQLDFPPTLTLPWPPASKNPTTQVISWNDFKTQYLQKLSPKERELVLGKAKNLAEQSRQAMGSYSYGRPSEAAESGPELTPQAIKNSAVRKLKADQNTRVKKLFDLAKKYLIEEIQSRASGGDKEQIARLVERLKSVQITDVNALETECESDPDNAFYNGITNKITICNGYSVSSDLRLIGVIGHELGHAIDPCHVTGCIVRFNQSTDKITQLFMDNKLPEEMQIALGLSGYDAKQMGRANHFLSQKALDRLVKEDFITVEQTGIKGSYPFDTTYRCLASRHGFSNASSSRHSTSHMAKRLKRYAGDKSDLMPVYVNPDFKECMEHGSSEMGEVMADVFGAKVLGRYAIDHDKRDFKDLLDASAIHLKGACHGEGIDGTHPFGRERFEKILIADPLVQKAFNCKETSDSFCMKKFGHLPHQLETGRGMRLQKSGPLKSRGSEEAVK